MDKALKQHLDNTRQNTTKWLFYLSKNFTDIFKGWRYCPAEKKSAQT